MTHEFIFPNFDIKSNVDINTIEASADRVTKGTITAAQKKELKTVKPKKCKLVTFS